MSDEKLFFCGVGGSGMLPMAVAMSKIGYSVTGSDRSYDAGRDAEKFEYLKEKGITMVPQDGEGLTKDFDYLVVSAAIEDTIPEVMKAKELGTPIKDRAEVLSGLLHQYKNSIGVAGTSGKSTTAAMIGWSLEELGKSPTLVNGAPLCNLSVSNNLYSSTIVGNSDICITECCELNGKVVLYKPKIAVLTNISLDHMSLEELKEVFKTYLQGAKIKVANICNEYVNEILPEIDGEVVTFGLSCPEARFGAENIKPGKSGITCDVIDRELNEKAELKLQIVGEHNVENALTCIAALNCLGVPLNDSVKALETFKGAKRRLETVGVKDDVIVIDDFGHNPKKIEASLKTLNKTDGRLLVFFQIHGYGPLKMMSQELLDIFKDNMRDYDNLYIPDVLYQGGTVSKGYNAKQFCDELKEKAVNVTWKETRDELANDMITNAKAGDRIVIMGARDDSLSDFARDILAKV